MKPVRAVDDDKLTSEYIKNTVFLNCWINWAIIQNLWTELSLMGLVSVVDRSILQGAKIPIDDKGGISLTNMLSKTLAPVTNQRWCSWTTNSGKPV